VIPVELQLSLRHMLSDGLPLKTHTQRIMEAYFFGCRLGHCYFDKSSISGRASGRPDFSLRFQCINGLTSLSMHGKQIFIQLQGITVNDSRPVCTLKRPSLFDLERSLGAGRSKLYLAPANHVDLSCPGESRQSILPLAAHALSRHANAWGGYYYREIWKVKNIFLHVFYRLCRFSTQLPHTFSDRILQHTTECNRRKHAAKWRGQACFVS
jgi:hypothetical protein